MELKEKVINIVANQFPKEDINPELNLTEDLNADSLDTVELVMALEEEFKIEIPDEDAANLLTVQDIIDYIRNKSNA